ncbi:hypothetical protein B1526_0897 [Bifidobacterium criceti]|uniref:Uncharacterized protein n=1 Tax=Bifidobacterium criceti TaxID=1960969 RepID=A0A2A2EG37_9BIFI|nr:hypothetical protein B1526_0897 [Bifidobacterium criceti]
MRQQWNPTSTIRGKAGDANVAGLGNVMMKGTCRLTLRMRMMSAAATSTMTIATTNTRAYADRVDGREHGHAGTGGLGIGREFRALHLLVVGAAFGGAFLRHQRGQSRDVLLVLLTEGLVEVRSIIDARADVAAGARLAAGALFVNLDPLFSDALVRPLRVAIATRSTSAEPCTYAHFVCTTGGYAMRSSLLCSPAASRHVIVATGCVLSAPTPFDGVNVNVADVAASFHVKLIVDPSAA